jgi:hypothetical protein
MQVIVKVGSLSDRECLRLAVRSGTLRARQFLTCQRSGLPVPHGLGHLFRRRIGGLDSFLTRSEGIDLSH